MCHPCTPAPLPCIICRVAMKVELSKISYGICGQFRVDSKNYVSFPVEKAPPVDRDRSILDNEGKGNVK